MIKEKHRLTGNLNAKQSLSSKLGNKIIYIDPLTQEKSVEPSKIKQIIIPDDGFNGLSKVTVNKIADNYIIPSGEIEVKENGNYDVTSKSSITVNVPEKKLGTKIITSNGTYQAINDELDGYSQVNVDVPADVNWDDYFVEPLAGGSDGSNVPSGVLFSGISRCIKKLPDDSTFENGQFLFYGCINLVDVSALENKSFSAKYKICNQMFQYCRSLEIIPYFDTKGVKDTSNMFAGCRALKNVPLLDTSDVTNMNGMFQSCNVLQTIPLLNTSNVTNMAKMFRYCYALTSIPLLDVSKATNMNTMFQDCYELVTIPSLNTLNVTSMSTMFSGCRSLETIPHIDTNKVTNMSYMFQNCKALTSLSKIHATAVTNLSNMFVGCTELTSFLGLENLGQAYSTSTGANSSNYTLNLSACTKLTEQSIINVLNNLYDIKTKGCKAQKVVLGATNLAKLTSTAGQTALSNAQTKGWTIS